MKALVLNEVKQPLVLQERPSPKAGKGQVIVKIKAAALNRRDYWITQGLYPGIRCPVILGSDGTGTADFKEKDVIINPGYNWGGRQEVQGGDFKILGMPDDGTFAEEIAVPKEQLFARPEHLSWEQAAALPLAGLTAYRALFKQGRLQSSQTVVVTGIGGGVACIALQFAVAAGATAIVTSSSQAKIDKAMAMGATAGFLYTAEDYASQVKAEFGPVHLIVDGAGGDGYGQLIEMACPGRTIVSYGITAGPTAKLELRKLYFKQLHLVGSTMGSPEDFTAMLEMVNEHKIEPVIDEVFDISDGNKAMEKMKVSSQFGKIVLRVSDK
ncbi:MAG: alcohol dehydrogenase [Planctomycetes bacterium RBG_13_50_24]|nr:MAG: alcohol dehydrogenase [Planctomycetes bacterium RBG_13_50_24]